MPAAMPIYFLSRVLEARYCRRLTEAASAVGANPGASGGAGEPTDAIGGTGGAGGAAGAAGAGGSGGWWNLNSTLDRPEAISDFYLSAFLQSMRQEGYSIFVVRGTLPPPASRHGPMCLRKQPTIASSALARSPPLS